MRFFKNTNELSNSIPGKFAKPMIIEGNTFVFFDEFEILLQKNENLSHGSIYFCFLKANNTTGYINC